MANDLVSICIPTLHREKQLQQLLRTIPETVEYEPYEIIVKHDAEPPANRGCPTVLADCVAESRGDFVVFMGNDALPQPGWLRLGMEAMDRWFPERDGLIIFQDSYWQAGELPIAFLGSKKLLPKLDGYFFNPCYFHCADSELASRCRQMNKYVLCQEAKVFHNHPIHRGMQDLDEVYKIAYDPVRRQADCDLLLERAKRYGFPIKQNFRPPQIPRRFFSVWFGDQPMPPLVERCLASQREFTKGMEHTVLRVPPDIPYVNAAMAARKFVKAVDYVKLWELYQRGGVYLDADVEFTKPFPNEFLTDRLFAGLERNGWIGNGVIGAAPGHPVLKACLDRIEREFRGDDDKNFESSVQVFTETIYQMGLEEHGVKLYPPQVFTPYDHQGKTTEITEDTVAYHHFMVTWGYPAVHPCIDLRPRLQRFGDVSRMKVLNVGIGSGLSGLATQLPALNFERLDHIEVHPPYIAAAKQKFWVAKEVNFFLDDLRKLPASDISSYDLVLCFDVLEHVEKQDALDFMAKCPRMLVFIPLEETPRCHREGADDIPSQDHLSCWRPHEFEDLGFVIELLPGFHREGNEVWDALWAMKGNL